jgi:hypothetical protein
VDSLEFFYTLTSLLKERNKYIWLHPDVKQAIAIKKVYFTYIMGDIAMCGYRNGDMCGNLLERGFFDVPIKSGEVPRVGNSVMSALNYCEDLLSPRGFCEHFLPSTYSTWKIESVQECQEPEYNKFDYTDPSDNKPKSLLAVDYEARENYEKAQTPMFLTYKGCIVFTWVLLCISMLREIGKGMTWIMQLPTQSAMDDHDAEEARSQRGAGHAPAIHSMSMRHRVILCIVSVCRLGMLSVLLFVGLNFLGRQNDYIDLLLDGVALIFIVDVAEILYERVLRQDVRNTAEEREPIEIVKIGIRSLTSSPDVMDMLWFIIMLIITIGFLMYYTANIVHPLYNALQCTCLSQGDHCQEAHTFSKSFWDQYWGQEVPSSIEEIKSLKVEFDSPAVEFQRRFADFSFSLAQLKRHGSQHHLQALS